MSHSFIQLQFFDVVEHPRNELAPVTTYTITAINLLQQRVISERNPKPFVLNNFPCTKTRLLQKHKQRRLLPRMLNKHLIIIPCYMHVLNQQTFVVCGLPCSRCCLSSSISCLSLAGVQRCSSIVHACVCIQTSKSVSFRRPHSIPSATASV